MIVIAVAALVATAAPVEAPPVKAPPVKAPPVVAVSARPIAAASTKAKSVPDLSAMVAVFDKLFPPQPEPDPARLALARVTVRDGLMPPGAFGGAMGAMMGSMVDRVLAMKESDLDGVLPGTKSSKGAKSKPASNKTLHQKLVDEDPHFDERMRLTRGAIATEMTRLSAIVEPRLEEALARAVARRFDPRQLTDINVFFATDTGKALGKQYMALWFDPDLSRAMMAGIPDMIALAPGAIKRIEAATAGLPKAKKKPTPVVVTIPQDKRKR